MSKSDPRLRDAERDSKVSRRTLIATGVSGGFALLAPPIAAQSLTGALSMQITISPNGNVATLINVFVVEPGRQQALLDLLIEGTETFFSKQPGFLAASFHKSKDGLRVVNYGQWRSARDIEVFRSHPDFRAYVARIVALAKSDAMLCDVDYVRSA
jgi:quinol monooxygenase YgiN